MTQVHETGPGQQATQGLSGIVKVFLAIVGLAFVAALCYGGYRLFHTDAKTAATPAFPAAGPITQTEEPSVTSAAADENARACAGIDDCRSVPWALFMKLMKSDDEVTAGGEVLDCTGDGKIKPVGEVVNLCSCQCKPAEQVVKK